MACEKCPFRTPVCTAFGNFCYLEVMEHAPNATLVMARSRMVGSCTMGSMSIYCKGTSATRYFRVYGRTRRRSKATSERMNIYCEVEYR